VLLRFKAERLGFLHRLEEMKSCVDQVLQYTTGCSEPDSLYSLQAKELLAGYYVQSGDFQAGASVYESLYEHRLGSIVRNHSLLERIVQGRMAAYRFLGKHE
jgi:hypothetical protein